MGSAILAFAFGVLLYLPTSMVVTLGMGWKAWMMTALPVALCHAAAGYLVMGGCEAWRERHFVPALLIMAFSSLISALMCALAFAAARLFPPIAIEAQLVPVVLALCLVGAVVCLGATVVSLRVLSVCTGRQIAVR